MEPKTESVLIGVTVPVFLVLIGIEFTLSRLHSRRLYTSRGTLTNIYLAALNFGLDTLLRATWLGVLYCCSRHFVARVANPWAYWISLLILVDFAFYFLHRVDHQCRLFWAVHATHHSADEFNLTVGIRSSVFQPVYRFAWFVPLALAGYRAEDIALMFSATQIYGLLIHTQYVGKLGPLEWVLATPSHHRVHHGSNPQYLDKNMGMVLIVWDRLFGTFAEEREEVRYGLTKAIAAHHPVKVVFHEWQDIVRDLRKPAPFWAKLMYLFGPPGWSHDASPEGVRGETGALDELPVTSA